MNLQKMADEVYEVNKANGWFEEDRGYAADIALLHSEVSEAFEAYRDHGFADMTEPNVVNEIIGPFGEVIRTDPVTLSKPEGVGSELADVLIRLLDTAKRRGWDLEYIARQSGDEDSSEEFIDGIARMHQTISGLLDSTGTILRMRAGDLYEDILSVAHAAGVDLEVEYARKLAFNRTRGHRHGGKRV